MNIVCTCGSKQFVHDMAGRILCKVCGKEYKNHKKQTQIAHS